ncbi:MAG: ribonuclease P protein component, partial [Sedimentisphaerales bacterium]|nr:ribonuclease P protein component [Sedimentisphaerales bacterium]
MTDTSNRRFRFCRRQRLKSRSDFDRVFAASVRAADERLIVYARANERDYCRLGLSVGKRLGPAVERNRYKRTLREAFRLLQHDLPAGYDYVLIPRAHLAASRPLYERSLL